jgi:hypothetical protein
VKKAIVLVVLVAAAFVGGALWMKHYQPAPAAAEHPAAAAESADEEAAGPQLSRDTNGNAVITMSDELQGDLGILVKSAAAFQMSPELKGYGKVMDPTPLAALMSELATAQATHAASSTELARLKVLERQGNASSRALQAAEIVELRDELAVRSTNERLALSWGRGVSDYEDGLPGFVRSLTSTDAALVRIDLPVGETLTAPPTRARITTLSGQSAEAEFLEPAPSVEPQLQGRGFIFLLKPNSLRLTPGESVVGYLKIPGEPLSGAIIPREAVVRTEGAGWVYVMNADGEAFTRVQVALDHPTEAGWFVTQGVPAGAHVVATGAQQLLSFEVKSAGGTE